VNDVLLGRFVQSGGDLADDVGGLPGIDPFTKAREKLAEVLPGDVFLGDEMNAVDAATSWICTMLAWTRLAAAWAS
jgi:hypothetical protein